jgi:hypothetical protein
MPKYQTKLTSVIVIDDIYDRFKIKSVDARINFQKLVNRALDLYINKEDFRKQIDNHNELITKGSKF